jgi:hypothetical protein
VNLKPIEREKWWRLAKDALAIAVLIACFAVLGLALNASGTGSLP